MKIRFYREKMSKVSRFLQHFYENWLKVICVIIALIIGNELVKYPYQCKIFKIKKKRRKLTKK